jgi:O-antigen/teichoic acid export membrane protein
VRHATRGGLLQLLYVCAQGLLTVYQVMVARLFGAAVYGLYGSAVSALDVLVRLGCFGADKAMLRFISAHRDQGDEAAEASALASGLRISLTVSSAIAIGVVIAAGPIARALNKPEIASVLPWFALGVPAGALASVLVAVGFGRRSTRMNLVARGLGEPLFLVAFALIVWVSGGGARGLAISHTTALIAVAVVAFVMLRRLVGPALLRRALRAPRHPQLLRFATPLAVLEVVNTLRQQIDTLVVLPLMTFEAAALYKASEVIGRAGAQIRYAFDGVAAPLFASAIAANDHDRLAASLHFTTRLVATLSIPLVATLIALRSVLLALFGPEFTAASTIVVIHLLGHLLNGTLGLAGQVIAMSGQARLMLITLMLALAGNIATCFTLIPRLGILGAAIGHAVAVATVTAGNLWIAYLVRRVSPLHRALAKPAVAGAVMVALQHVTMQWSAPPVVRITVAVAGGLGVYVAVLLALGLAAEERDLVRKWLRR